MVCSGLRRIFAQLRSWWPRLSLLLVVGLVLGFFFERRAELESLRHLHLVSPVWLLLTITAQVLVLLSIAWQLQTILARFGYPLPLLRLLRADLHRVAVASVVPAGAAVGTAIFAREMESQAVRREAAIATLVVYGLCGIVSFVVLIPLTLWSLTRMPALALAGLPLADGLALLSFLFLLGLGVLLAVRHWLTSSDRWPLIRRVLEHLSQLGSRTVIQVVLLALLVDVLNVVILSGVLHMLGHPRSWSVALVAYQGSYVFAFLLPVGQGTGAVELAGSAILEGLGVPGPAAVAAVLLWRAHELWAPLAAGTILWVQREPLVRRAVDRFPALLLFWSGVVSIFGLLEPHPHRLLPRGLEHAALIEPWELSRHAELLLGFAAVLVAQQVWRLKRTGWILAVTLAGITTVHQLVGRRDPLLLALSGVALLVLLLRWRDYRARSDVPSLLRGAVIASGSLIVAVAYGTIGLLLLSRHALAPPVDGWWGAVWTLVASAFGFREWPIHPGTRYGAWFLDSVTLLTGVSVLAALWSIGRPVVWRYWQQAAHRARARELIEQCGNSSLDFFKVWPDKVFFFSRASDGVVSFRPINGVALVLGDPNACSREAFERLLCEFLDFCQLNDWEPAFHQVGTAFQSSYLAQGLRTLKIGEEAIVELAEWSLARPGFKDLRYLVRRFEREGFRFEVVTPPLPDSLLQELADVNREWLTVPGRRERFFTLGQFTIQYVRKTPVAVLRARSGTIVAFANLVPSGVPGEITIDLMRRRHEPYGAMDVLTVSLLEYCRREGFTRFSLGLAPLAGVELPVPGMDPIKERFYQMLNRQFSFRGLYHFKAKFEPRWEPRYLVYRSAVSLPRILLALVTATEGRRDGRRDFGDEWETQTDWFDFPLNA
ncbi:MAG: phosphatidylglycerol lysyltransferase domain-containing protein [Thermomicrobium sp.]|nr:phosphatidylglycerol lysyltransferase domain-containing protein [Thermomicrobium sp.]MDW7982719.1 phosphatidylglycerol lysyltransferase domain-containing protein [Thermomicrobium sp.]